MITGLIISLLIFCHVVGDFYLQTDELAIDKLSDDKNIALNAQVTHCFHHLIITSIVMFFFFGFSIMIYVLILAGAHWGIDYCKIALRKKYDNSLRLFLIDQSIHILVILFVIPYTKYINEIGFSSVYSRISILLMGGFPFLDSLDNNKWIMIIHTITLYLFIINGGTAISKLFIPKTETDSEELRNLIQQSRGAVAVGSDIEVQSSIVEKIRISIDIFLKTFKSIPAYIIKKKVYSGGEIIGIIERLLICTFVIQESYVAISSVIAAKAIARYKKIEQDAEFSDKFLIGTLLSVTVAVVAGFVYRWLIIVYH